MVKFGGVFQAIKTTCMNWCVFNLPRLSLGEKKLSFKCGRSRTSEMPRWKDSLKLGSLPSRTDEISFLYVIPKSNCLTKWHKNPVFAREFNTTHCHIVLRQRRESRFWKVFRTFQSYLLKGRWRGSPKPRLSWELEALFGIPAKINHFLGIWGSLLLWLPYPFQRHQKFPLAKPGIHQKIREKHMCDMTLQFLAT